MHTAAEGDGPVNALDRAVRKALLPHYPELAEVHLVDYKVRIVDEHLGTGARPRVIIESARGDERWSTVGCSENIIEASWLALCDGLELALLRGAERASSHDVEPEGTKRREAARSHYHSASVFPSTSASRPLEQLPLSLDAPAIPAQPAILPHDAMAGNDQRHLVGRAGAGHGARGRRLADVARDLGIAPGLAPRNPLQRLPYPPLERRAPHVERQPLGLVTGEPRDHGAGPALELVVAPLDLRRRILVAKRRPRARAPRRPA